MAKKKVQDQGAQILRSEAYIQYAAMTKDAAQRRYWTFYRENSFPPPLEKGGQGGFLPSVKKIPLNPPFPKGEGIIFMIGGELPTDS